MHYEDFKHAVAQPHRGGAELGAVVVLYAIYELARGFGDTTLDAARANTAWIVDLERSLGLYVESGVQAWAQSLPGLPSILGIAYVTLHIGATAAALIWLYRAHRERFALVRNALVLATAASLVVYVMFPAAPPRLAGLGFVDTVSQHTHVDLSSDLLGSLYNPFAAVPSMHFGYAVIVGAALFAYAQHRSLRWIGAVYPPFMLFVIVATGNHFIFDAVAGGLIVAAAWLLARALVAAPHVVRQAVPADA